MKYQDHFPTIWDTPSKTSTKPATQTPAKKALTPVKEAFLSIWDAPTKRQPSA
ncbi:hypothetical protein LCGC14_0191920 [marine sediment metagenome]|uniref:Uncharacterized protein n=1 Tax=marine sediment metagenome TaxID=412755 RepID=A0A0F9V371_9ZZZZ|nr:hypothetical protein [Halomonas sp.]